jgi:iron complex outermembrane receptor protein
VTHSFSRVAAAGVFSLATVATSAALAQSAATSGETEQLTEVVVTGSRIINPSFTAPTPVTVISADTIQNEAPAQINDVINQMPAFRVTTTPAGSGRGAGLQSGLQAALDLRGLTAERTLNLIDGKRVVGTTQRTIFDTNMIPVSLIDRVDVVTGGASAAYGSDAVAGVVNFILNDKLQGVKISAQTGATTQYNDSRQNVFNLGAGTSFAGGRGHVIFGADYADTRGAGNIYTRAWGRQEPGVVATSLAQRQALGLPAQYFTNGVELGNAATGGLITTAASDGLVHAVTAAGATVIFPNGPLFGAGGTSTMVGSTANYGYNPNSAFLLQSPNKRQVAYGRVKYDFTDTLQGYAEGQYGKTTLPRQRDGYIVTTLTVPKTLLPAALQPLYAAAPGTTVSINRINLENGGGDNAYQTGTLWRGVVGLTGKLASKWTWDVSYQSGVTHEAFGTTGTSTAAEQYAVNSCTGTVSATLALYNSLSGKTCVPFNPFAGVQSDAGSDYWHTDQTQNIHLRLESGQAVISGSPVTLWAGDLSLAGGIEWRRTSLNIVGTALGAANAYTQGNFGGFGGSDSVKEAFAEVGLPLLKDLPGVKSLDLNAAYRDTDYAYSGKVNTWKTGLSYEPMDGLRFRVTQSRDIRAPTLNELFFVGGLLPTTINGFGANGANTQVNGTGNPLLKPEKADTFTAGIVLQPTGALSGFTATVDYYNVTVKGAIARLATGQTQSQCQVIIQSGGTTCPGITFVPGTTAFATLSNQSQNLNKLRVSGVDLELGYRFATLGVIPGALKLSVLANRAFHDQQTLSTGLFELAGSSQGVPSWAGVGTIAWDVARFGAQVQFRGFTGVRFDTSTLYPASTAAATPQTYTALGVVDPSDAGYLNTNANSINIAHFGGVTYMDLAAHWDVSENVQLFGNLNNALDRDMPTFAAIAVTTGNRNINYDVLGRAYKIGVRVRF